MRDFTLIAWLACLLACKSSFHGPADSSTTGDTGDETEAAGVASDSSTSSIDSSSTGDGDGDGSTDETGDGDGDGDGDGSTDETGDGDGDGQADAGGLYEACPCADGFECIVFEQGDMCSVSCVLATDCDGAASCVDLEGVGWCALGCLAIECPPGLSCFASNGGMLCLP